MARLVIDQEKLKCAIYALIEKTNKGWVSSKEVDMKSIWTRSELPCNGVLATNLIGWLLKKEYLVERRRGRLGVIWKWNCSYTDPESLSTSFIKYIHSLDVKLPTELKKTCIRPAEFKLRDQVYILLDNKIKKVEIRQLRLDDLNNLKYGIRVVYDSVSSIKEFDYDQLYISIDELLNKLKDDAE